MNTPSPSSVNRRDFLKTGGLGLAALSGLGIQPTAKSVQTSGRPASGRAKNIIFLVSDGMSGGTFSTANQFLQWKEGRPSHWAELLLQGKGRFSMMDTASRSSIVTDSAAGSSAWGCGQRVHNGRINMAGEGRPLRTILEIARDAGKATGLVTTATVTHATPAGFGANVMGRGDERQVMEQYLEREYDLLLGGGRQFIGEFEGQPSLLPRVEAGGYEFVEDRNSLLNAKGKDARLIGLFAEEHLPYEVDRMYRPEALHEQVPSLAEMTQVALRRLSTNPNGFLVQIEGARVDMAAHLNDTGGLLHDQLAFDQAVKVALDFAEEHDDTLVIVTTDHGNASPGLNSGNNGGRRNFQHMDAIRGSYRTLRDRLDRDQSAEEIQSHVAAVLGQEIEVEHAELMLRHMNNEFRLPYRRFPWLASLVGQIIANHTDFGWIGNQHTAEHVYLNVVGPGSELVQPFTRNTDLFDLMIRSAGMEAWRT